MAPWRASDRVARTFASVFPHVVEVGGFLRLGSDRPIEVERDLLAARLASERPVPATDVERDLRPRDEYFLSLRR